MILAVPMKLDNHLSAWGTGGPPQGEAGPQGGLRLALHRGHGSPVKPHTGEDPWESSLLWQGANLLVFQGRLGGCGANGEQQDCRVGPLLGTYVLVLNWHRSNYGC